MNKYDKLAIDGGTPARTLKNYPMYPGGLAIDEREEQAVLEVLRSKRLFRYYGPYEGPSKVEEFEKKFAAMTGVKYALATNSCTNALQIALLAAGIQPGDEVIVPAYTFVSTATAVVAANAIPVIVEMDDTYSIDPAEIEKNITPKTKAIIPVHMRGVPCDMDAVMAIARKYNLLVIEDVAQSNGGTYKGQPLGTFGDISCFSFQFNKVITAGEGGIIITNSRDMINRAKGLHDTGYNWRHDESMDKNNLPCFPGFGSRMTEIQGAILNIQLEKRDPLIKAMKKNSKQINDVLRNIPGVTVRRLNDPDGDIGICVVFSVETRERALKICKALAAEGIEAGTMLKRDVFDLHVYYHWHHILNKRGNNDSGYPFTLTERTYDKDMCPKTIELLERSIHMDVSPELTEKDIAEITYGLEKVLYQVK